ncbi:MAG: hypothetical protein ABIR15_11685 [Chitinophagaceae bacterium]
MKNIPLPVFFILLSFMAFAWWCNRYLQLFIKPRASLARLLLYLLTGMLLVFGGVYGAVRVILWVFPPGLK